MTTAVTPGGPSTWQSLKDICRGHGDSLSLLNAVGVMTLDDLRALEEGDVRHIQWPDFVIRRRLIDYVNSVSQADKDARRDSLKACSTLSELCLDNMGAVSTLGVRGVVALATIPTLDLEQIRQIGITDLVVQRRLIEYWQVHKKSADDYQLIQRQREKEKAKAVARSRNNKHHKQQGGGGQSNGGDASFAQFVHALEHELDGKDRTSPTSLRLAFNRVSKLMLGGGTGGGGGRPTSRLVLSNNGGGGGTVSRATTARVKLTRRRESGGTKRMSGINRISVDRYATVHPNSSLIPEAADGNDTAADGRKKASSRRVSLPTEFLSAYEDNMKKSAASKKRASSPQPSPPRSPRQQQQQQQQQQQRRPLTARQASAPAMKVSLRRREKRRVRVEAATTFSSRQKHFAASHLRVVDAQMKRRSLDSSRAAADGGGVAAVVAAGDKKQRHRRYQSRRRKTKRHRLKQRPAVAAVAVDPETARKEAAEANIESVAAAAAAVATIMSTDGGAIAMISDEEINRMFITAMSQPSRRTPLWLSTDSQLQSVMTLFQSFSKKATAALRRPRKPTAAEQKDTDMLEYTLREIDLTIAELLLRKLAWLNTAEECVTECMGGDAQIAAEVAHYVFGTAPAEMRSQMEFVLFEIDDWEYERPKPAAAAAPVPVPVAVKGTDELSRELEQVANVSVERELAALRERNAIFEAVFLEMMETPGQLLDMTPGAGAGAGGGGHARSFSDELDIRVPSPSAFTDDEDDDDRKGLEY